MEVNRKNFPPINTDNDEVFIAHIEGVLSSVDELCSLEITKLPETYRIRIAPSHPRYTNMIIEELLKFFNKLGIRIDMSKSITTSAVITFNINTSK
jgi:hypothetical protein